MKTVAEAAAAARLATKKIQILAIGESFMVCALVGQLGEGRTGAGSGRRLSRIADTSVPKMLSRAKATTAVAAAVPAKLLATMTRPTAALREAVVTASVLRVA